MNQKKKFKPAADAKLPVYLYEGIAVVSGSKTYVISKGTLVSVHRKPGLIAGKYEVLYAEPINGVVLLHVEGPDSRIVSERRRKIIREADIKTVHVKTRRK